jgi:hypothetical protein
MPDAAGNAFVTARLENQGPKDPDFNLWEVCRVRIGERRNVSHSIVPGECNNLVHEVNLCGWCGFQIEVQSLRSTDKVNNQGKYTVVSRFPCVDLCSFPFKNKTVNTFSNDLVCLT